MSEKGKTAVAAGGAFAAIFGFLAKSADDVARVAATGGDDVVRLVARSADDIAFASDDLARVSGLADDLVPRAVPTISEDLSAALAAEVERVPVLRAPKLTVPFEPPVPGAPALRLDPRKLRLHQLADDVAERTELLRDLGLDGADLVLDLALDDDE